MFHCHNLIHEDHDMMAALNVTALKDLGYDEKTSFIDPMDTKYRAKSFAPSDLTDRKGDFDYDAIEKKCKDFQDMDAYKKVNEVEEKLEEYWKTRQSSQSTLQTVTSSNGGGGAASVSASGSSGSGSSVASSAPVASSTSGASSTPGSTLVTSVSSAKTTSSTKSDDKGGKKTTTSSSTARTSSSKKK